MPIIYDGSRGGHEQPLMPWQIQEQEALRKNPLNAKRISPKIYKETISAHEVTAKHKNKKQDSEPYLLFDIEENPNAYKEFLENEQREKAIANGVDYSKPGKVCGKCKHFKSLSEYSINPRTRDYYKLCNHCRVIQTRARYNRDLRKIHGELK